MRRHLPRVRLRPAHLVARRIRAHRDQAHRRRSRAFPRAVLLLPVVAAAGLALALRPGDTIRATPSWSWAPLPTAAFESLLSSDHVAARASRAERAEEGSLRTAPSSTIAPAAPAAWGSRPAVYQTIPSPSAAPRGPTHVVAPGDTLWVIARRHSADLRSILRWNVGIDPYRLFVGQRVLVPGGSKMKPLPQPARATPRVRSVVPVSVDRPAAARIRGNDHLWPLPIRGILTRRFSSAHPGIDIAAPRGTRVRAIAGGTIVWAGWKNNGGGYVVEIEHPDGMRSTYNHNSKVTVKRGDEVARGETIALVGSTGWSTGPHLDMRIRMGGRLVDPLRFY